MGGIGGLRLGGWMKRIRESTLDMCSSTRLVELCGTRMDNGIRDCWGSVQARVVCK